MPAVTCFSTIHNFSIREEQVGEPVCGLVRFDKETYIEHEAQYLAVIMKNLVNPVRD
jgi:hypothetical protein